MWTYKKLMPLALMAGLLGSLTAGLLTPAQAHSSNWRNRNSYYQRGYQRQPYYSGWARYERHPYLKRAGIGAAAGAGLGAVLAPDGARVDTAVKGGLIGAGAGLGYAYLKDRGYLNRW